MFGHKINKLETKNYLPACVICALRQIVRLLPKQTIITNHVWERSYSEYILFLHFFSVVYFCTRKWFNFFFLTNLIIYFFSMTPANLISFICIIYMIFTFTQMIYYKPFNGTWILICFNKINQILISNLLVRNEQKKMNNLMQQQCCVTFLFFLVILYRPNRCRNKSTEGKKQLRNWIGGRLPIFDRSNSNYIYFF